VGHFVCSLFSFLTCIDCRIPSSNVPSVVRCAAAAEVTPPPIGVGVAVDRCVAAIFSNNQLPFDDHSKNMSEACCIQRHRGHKWRYYKQHNRNLNPRRVNMGLVFFFSNQCPICYVFPCPYTLFQVLSSGVGFIVPFALVTFFFSVPQLIRFHSSYRVAANVTSGSFIVATIITISTTIRRYTSVVSCRSSRLSRTCISIPG
jgi:hypothetical protein